MSRRILQAAAVWLMLFLMIGCGEKQDRTRKLRDLEFTVLTQDQLPAELQDIIEERKQDGFKLTFLDENDLYICVGYGSQPTGGYSISVTELYETENAICVHTNLLGPSAEENHQENPTCPYIVLRMEKLDKAVVFE